MLRQQNFTTTQQNGAITMNFDVELENLLKITDHDELIEEYAFFCADVDCYFNELDQKAEKKPDWWWIGLGFKEAASPRHYEEARFIYKQFLKFKDVEGESFSNMIARFTQTRFNGAAQKLDCRG